MSTAVPTPSSSATAAGARGSSIASSPRDSTTYNNDEDDADDRVFESSSPASASQYQQQPQQHGSLNAWGDPNDAWGTSVPPPAAPATQHDDYSQSDADHIDSTIPKPCYALYEFQVGYCVCEIINFA